MKLLSAAQIREADAYTIANEPIASLALMERASTAFVFWYTPRFSKDHPVHIFCGKGNNGADGLAIGRLLMAQGYTVQCMACGEEETATDDWKANAAQWREKKGDLPFYNGPEDFPELLPQTIIIDALLGSGLSRPVKGVFSQLIKQINSVPHTRVSVDIASGLFADAHTPANAVAVHPHYTVTFQQPKLPQLLPDYDRFTGKWHAVSIGLHPDYLAQCESPYHYVEASQVAPLLPSRPKYGHKGNFGKVLLVGGSHGKMGAAVLMARACLRMGAGLVTTLVPDCGYTVMQTAVPEAMTLTSEPLKHVDNMEIALTWETVGVGPGMGTHISTAAALLHFLESAEHPLVLDADALNILAENRRGLPLLPPNSILTPHPGEFQRLVGTAANSFDALERLRTFAQQYSVNVLLKGAHTAMATPTGEVWFNATGNPGMATAGSGDALTGIITALLAQQPQNPTAAMIAGVYLHGLAGDLAATKVGEFSLNASDIIAHLPEAILQVRPVAS